MNAARGARRGRDRFARMWWIGPTVLVAGSGAALAIVAAPGLSSHVQVPSALVVRATAPSPTAGPTTRTPAPRHTAARATPTATPSPTEPPPTPHVVTPVRPVVTVSEDDRRSAEAGDR